MRWWRYSILMIVFAIIPGLSSGSAARKQLTNGNETAVAGSILPPKSWEVRTEQFETVVNDVFYAERSQNDQIMPTAVTLSNADGKFIYQIDRMIYPTLGNPNLYVRHSRPGVSVLWRASFIVARWFKMNARINPRRCEGHNPGFRPTASSARFCLAPAFSRA